VTRAELDDERSFLLDSLEDLERERDAGDLSEDDYEVLRDRYTRRTAEVLRALERVPSPEPGPSAGASTPGTGPGPTPAPRRRRTLLVAGLLAIVAAVALVVVVTTAGARLPGQTATGSVSLSRAAQERRTLAQAQALEVSGDKAGALGLYGQVLAVDPTQPEALAESGWLEFEAGVQAKDAAVLAAAQAEEQKAQDVEPSAYAPHLYLGSMYLTEGNAAGAVTEYRRFLADGPPASVVDAARPFIDQAFQKVGQPVPASVGAAPTTTSPAAP
jgi:hypothetical protein